MGRLELAFAPELSPCQHGTLVGMFDVVAEVTNNVRASALRRDSSRREQIAFARVALLERSLARGSCLQTISRLRSFRVFALHAYFVYV